MPSASSSKKKGFTLFELLLVILLVGILYGVFINKLSIRAKGGIEAPDIMTIGAFLKSFTGAAEGGEVSLVCLDQCKTCSVYIDANKTGPDVTLFGTVPTVYRRDEFGQFREIGFLPVKDDDRVLQDVCFRYTLYGNGSGSSYIVGYNDVYYLFDAYRLTVTKFSTLEAAAEAYGKTDLLPDDERLYTF